MYKVFYLLTIVKLGEYINLAVLAVKYRYLRLAWARATDDESLDELLPEDELDREDDPLLELRDELDPLDDFEVLLEELKKQYTFLEKLVTFNRETSETNTLSNS